MLESYARWIVRCHRAIGVAVFIFSLLLITLAGQRVARDGIPIDFSPQTILTDTPERLERLEVIEDTFGREDNTLVFMVIGALDSGPAVSMLRTLHARLEAHPAARAVDSPVNASLPTVADGVLTVVTPFQERSPPEALEMLADDPITRGLVVSADRQIAMVRVRLDPALERVGDLTPHVDALVEIAAAIPRPPGIDVQPTGIPQVRVDVVRSMVRDQLVFVPVIGAAFALIGLAVFRRPGVAWAPLTCVLVADLWAVCALVASGVVLNMLSVLVPILVVVIGIADGVHLTGRYRDELAESGSEEALVRTLAHMGPACFLTTFTTAAGFASLAVADTPVLVEFGLHAAFAVLVCWAATMVLLPAWLVALPPRAFRVAGASRSRGMLRVVDAFVARRAPLVLAGCVVAMVAAAAAGSTIQPNSHLTDMYRDDHPQARAIATADARLGGIIPVMVHVEGEPGALLEPSNLARIQRMESALRESNGAGWTMSLSGGLLRLHETLRGEPRLPPTGGAASQEVLLAELSGFEPLRGLATPELDQARILALCRDIGGVGFIALRDHLIGVADEIFEGSGLRVEVTGDGLVTSAGIHRLMSDLIASVGVIYAVIGVTLWGLSRSLRVALVAALPNVLPLVFLTASLAALGLDVQTHNVACFSIAIGLAVDDTIHFVARFGQERRAGRSVGEAVSRTYQGAGHAIVLTSILLICGFGLLIASDLTATRQLGYLTCLTVVAALIGDLLMLPAMLHLLGRRAATMN